MDEIETGDILVNSCPIFRSLKSHAMTCSPHFSGLKLRQLCPYCNPFQWEAILATFNSFLSRYRLLQNCSSKCNCDVLMKSGTQNGNYFKTVKYLS